MLPSRLQDTLFVNDSSGALLVTAQNGMPQIFKRGAVKPLEEFGSYKHKMWPVRRCARVPACAVWCLCLCMLECSF